jgi:ribosomal protein S18 acetylase RimI-like enzyme
MNAPAFRLAGEGDAAMLAGFMSRNFLATYGECSTPANIAATIAKHYGLEAQQRQLADRTRINLVMELDGAIAGHAQLRLFGDTPERVRPLPTAEISRFYVDTQFHGRGLAQAMMAEVRRLALARGARSLWLSVWQEQPQAIRFYEKEGFRVVGTLVFEVGDDPKDDWLMLSPLASAPPGPAAPAAR